MEHYIELLKKIFPQDENINEQNLGEIFCCMNNGISINDIFHNKLMFCTIAALIKMLYRDDKIHIKKNIIIGKNLPIYQYPLCSNVLRSDIDLSKAAITKKIFKNRKSKPNLSFFQSYNTYESLKRRLMLMQQFGDLHDKKVVFLGDDELFSVFFALNAKSYKRILVLDIDKNILKEVEHYSNKYNLKIETRLFDVFDKHDILPDFDLFFASGLKNLAGLLMFIYTGAKFLKNGGGETGYFTYYPFSRSLQNSEGEQNKYNFSLQKNLLEHGFFIEHLSVCDETKIDDSLCVELMNWFCNGSDYVITNDAHFMESDHRNKSLTKDPRFPYISLQPINVARIKRHYYCDQKINNYMNIARRLNNGKMEFEQ